MSYRILVAEDELGLRQHLCALLNTSEYTADSVRDGDSALEAAATGRYDLIIIETLLSPGSGWEVLRKLRSLGNRTPILMLTFLGQMADRCRELNHPIDHCLVKPFRNEELLHQVRRFLDRSASP